MIPIHSLSSISDDLKDSSVKIAGILVCHPNSPLGKEEICDHLDFFHNYSGNDVNFYCIGYGAYLPQDSSFIGNQTITIIVDDIKWTFSGLKFSEVIKEIESNTSWKFTGETTLIICDVINHNLSFDTAIVFDLERMIKDKVISSVRSLFVDIIRYCQSQEWQNISHLSNHLGKNKGVEEIKEACLTITKTRKIYQQFHPFAVRSIGKE